MIDIPKSLYHYLRDGKCYGFGGSNIPTVGQWAGFALTNPPASGKLIVPLYVALNTASVDSDVICGDAYSGTTAALTVKNLKTGGPAGVGTAVTISDTAMNAGGNYWEQHLNNINGGSMNVRGVQVPLLRMLPENTTISFYALLANVPIDFSLWWVEI